MRKIYQIIMFIFLTAAIVGLNWYLIATCRGENCQGTGFIFFASFIVWLLLSGIIAASPSLSEYDEKTVKMNHRVRNVLVGILITLAVGYFAFWYIDNH